MTVSTAPTASAADLPAGLLTHSVTTLPDTGGEFTLDLRKVTSAQRVRTRKGARIQLRITAAKAEELHLHGYDLSARIKAGETTTMDFIATRSGRFELETHHGHRTLLVLEIVP